MLIKNNENWMNFMDYLGDALLLVPKKTLKQNLYIFVLGERYNLTYINISPLLSCWKKRKKWLASQTSDSEFVFMHGSG